MATSVVMMSLLDLIIGAPPRVDHGVESGASMSMAFHWPKIFSAVLS
jgi:hypothetical protein